MNVRMVNVIKVDETGKYLQMNTSSNNLISLYIKKQSDREVWLTDLSKCKKDESE